MQSCGTELIEAKCSFLQRSVIWDDTVIWVVPDEKDSRMLMQPLRQQYEH